MLKCKSKFITLILALSMVLVNITGVMAQEEYVTCLRDASEAEIGTTPAWAEGGRSGSSSMTSGTQVVVVGDEAGTEQKALKVDSSYSGNTTVYNYLKIHSDKAFNLADGDVTIVMRAKASTVSAGSSFFRVFGTTEADTSTELIHGGLYVGGTNVVVADEKTTAVLPVATLSSDTYLYFRQTLSGGKYTVEYSTDGTTYKGTRTYTCTTYPEIINGVYLQIPFHKDCKNSSLNIDFVEFKQKAPKTLVVTDSIPAENKTLYGKDAVIRFNYEVSSVGIENAVEVTKESDVLTYGTDYTLSAQNNDITVHFVNPENGAYSVKVNDKLNYNQTDFVTPKSGYEKTISFNIENSDDLYIGFGNYFAEDVPEELVCKTYHNGSELTTANFVINKSVQSDENTQSGKAAFISWESKNSTTATGKISIPFGKEYKTAAGDITVIMRAKVKSANSASYTKFMGLGGSAGEESKTVGGLYVGNSSVIYNSNTGLTIFSSLASFASDNYVYIKQVVSGDQYTCMTSADGITWSAGKTATISNGLDTISSIDFILPHGNHASEFYIDFAKVIYESYDSYEPEVKYENATMTLNNKNIIVTFTYDFEIDPQVVNKDNVICSVGNKTLTDYTVVYDSESKKAFTVTFENTSIKDNHVRVATTSEELGNSCTVFKAPTSVKIDDICITPTGTEGNVNVSANICTNTANTVPEESMYMVATKNYDGRLIDVALERVGGNGEIPISVQLKNYTNEYVLEAFLWDKNQEPLTYKTIHKKTYGLDKVNNSTEDINVVGIGGSITEGGNYTTPFIESWQEDRAGKITFINKGVGGTTSEYGTIRFAEDVLAYNPDVVIIEFTLNDLSGNKEGCKKYVESFIRQAQSAEHEPVLLFVHVPDRRSTSDGVYWIDSNVASYNEVLSYYGLTAIDAHGLVVESINQSEEDDITWDTYVPSDNVHFNKEQGQLISDLMYAKFNSDAELYLKKADIKSELFNTDYAVHQNSYNVSSIYANYDENWIDSDISDGDIVTEGYQQPTSKRFDKYMQTVKKNSKMSFEFKGTKLVITSYMNNKGGSAMYRLYDKNGNLERSGIISNYNNSPGLMESTILKIDGLKDEEHKILIKTTDEGKAFGIGEFWVDEK